RDTRRLAARTNSSAQGIIDLLRFDLANSRSLSQSPDGLTIVLVGHGALDRRALTPNNRLVRVTYRVDSSGTFTRQQEYLDEPARPQRWNDLVATGVARVDITTTSNDSEPVAEAAIAPAMLGARRIGDVRVAPQEVMSTSIPSRV